MARTKTKPRLKKEEHGYEFGGPFLVAGIVFGLPFAVYLATFLCNDVSGCPAPSVLHPTKLTLKKLKHDVAWPGFEGLINIESFVGVLAYYASSFILYALLPAQEVQGTELRSGGKLKYRFNAFNSAMVILAIAAAGTLSKGSSFSLWTFIWDNYVQILTSNILIAYALATFVYVRSFSVKPGNKEKRELAAGGHSGNMFYDWFIGRELNPPVQIPFIGNVEIKSFMEERPGMLGWIILDLAFAARQYHNYGTITDSMLLVCFSQFVYFFDAIWNEAAMLTQMDMMTDGFGFMLAFGDLVWLPFTYSLQARYLAMHPVRLGFWGIAAVFAVQLSGYYIFRASNSEKDRFRMNPNDPSVAHLEYIETKQGSKLITSGWWGRARHINYLGDWLMSWAYCLPTGIAGYVIQHSLPFKSALPRAFRHESANSAIMHENGSWISGPEVVPGEARGWGMLITYFYMVYFAVLLIHRERRDDQRCRRKYGKDWDAYCKKVPWRILPGVY